MPAPAKGEYTFELVESPGVLLQSGSTQQLRCQTRLSRDPRGGLDLEHEVVGRGVKRVLRGFPHVS